MSRHTLRAAAAVVLGLAADNGFADYLPFPPKREVICAGGSVDRDHLAAYVLRKSPVSLLALDKLGSPPPQDKKEIVARLVDMNKVCEKDCAASDATLINEIRGEINQFLSGSSAPTFKPERPLSASDYLLRQRGGEIACAPETTVTEAPGAVFEPPPKDKSPIRVRGKAEQLYIDRSAKSDFATTDKAIASYDRDDVAGTNALKILGYVGYRLDMLDDKVRGQRWDLIPYVGLDRNIVRADPESTAKASAKSILYVGALSSTYLITRFNDASLGHLINFKPEFQGDHRSGSRLVVAAIEYLPVRNGLLNDFFPLDRSNEYFASFKPIFALKANAGHYLDKGSGATNSRSNYVRAGAKVGFGLSSDNPYVPLDFAGAYTAMHAFSGGPNITYRELSVTYNFDPNKFFGLTLTLKKGRREDTGVQDDDVTIGLSARY